MSEITLTPITRSIDCPRHRPCIDLSYYDHGGGETLVLVHGLGGDAAGWRQQIAVLSDSWRVVAMDLRGHGGSGYRPEEAITLRAFADDLAALLRSLGVEQAHFCGSSLGGMIVLELWVRFPALLKSLILADTTAFFPPPQMLADFLRLFDQVDLAAWAGFMAPRLLGPKASASLEEEMRRTMAATSRAVYRQGLVAAFQADYRWMLPLVDIPTLIVVGEEDQATPIGYARFLASRIKGSALRLVRAAAHLPHRENPEEFNRILKEHLERIRERPGTMKPKDKKEDWP
uniref:Alpha/beta fold hydrolase n=1 Tax=Desulfobacca acetoxidans TaxID=60893 RepID=A0A7C3UYU5_9BACT